MWMVLIVPLWNWNNVEDYTLEKLISSNRTFMELKYVSKYATKDMSFVLIVPLWNWNTGSCADTSARPQF